MTEEKKEVEAVESVPEELTEYENLVRKYGGDHVKATFEYCYLHNIFFNSQILNNLLKSKDDSVYNKMPDIYIDTINADFRFQDLHFFDQLKMNNFEKIYSESLDLLSLSDDDKKSRQQIIETFLYDPFKNEPIEDRPQLYRDLAGMTTEAMRKDVAKQKAALSIVRSYANIEHYQKRITELSNSGTIDEDTQKQLDSYLKVISNIQSTINQTAEKNNFTVKGLGSNGKGMLSDVLNQVGTQVVDSAVVNYYDIATSEAIEEVANIS